MSDDQVTPPTPREILNSLWHQRAGVQAMVDAMIRANDPTQGRHMRELLLSIKTIDQSIREAQANLPPAAEADPASQHAAIVAYVKGLPADDPLRTAGLPKGTRLVLP